MICCDAIVLGAGGVGSAALMHLARQGSHAIGLDRFLPPHDRGSSHGQTRAIRQAYFEHPDYVPLLRRAYQLWDDLEAAAGRTLFHRVGLLEAGPADGIVVPGVLASARQHQLAVQRWTFDECRRNVPQIEIPESSEIVFEENAGFLLVEECVEAQLSQARQAGAELRQETVRSWAAEESGVRVTTDENEYTAGALIVTAGAWAGELLADLRLPLTVRPKHLHWHPTGDARMELAGRMPVFFIETPDKCFFYGFPKLDDRGVKVAEHSGGGSTADPLTVSREVDPEDRRRVQQFIAEHLPTLDAEPADHAVCLYTMTPDEHFLVDRHPRAPQVCFAAGLSGHGFKFTTALGEALAQLALGQPLSTPLGFLSLSRLQG